MGATITFELFSFIDRLLSAVDRITAPGKVRRFPQHYHVIEVISVDGKPAYLIFDFDKKSKYAVHPN